MIWALRNQTSSAVLKQSETARKYTEKQQDIHQPQISIIILTLFSKRL